MRCFLAFLLCLPATLAQTSQAGADGAAALLRSELLEGHGKQSIDEATSTTRRFASGAAAESTDAPEIPKAHIACSKRDALELVGKGGRDLRAAFEGLIEKIRDHIFATASTLDAVSSSLEKDDYPQPIGMCCCGEEADLRPEWIPVHEYSPVAQTPLMNQEDRSNTGWSNHCDNETVPFVHDVWYGGAAVENRSGAYIGGWTLEKEVLFVDALMTSWPEEARNVEEEEGGRPGAWYRGPSLDQLPVKSFSFFGPSNVVGMTPATRDFGHSNMGLPGPTSYGWFFGYNTDLLYQRQMGGKDHGVDYAGDTEPEGYPGLSLGTNGAVSSTLAQNFYVTADKDMTILGAHFGKGSAIVSSNVYYNMKTFKKLDAVRNIGALNIIVSTKHGALVTKNDGEVQAVWGENATLNDVAMLDRSSYIGNPNSRPFKSVREAPTGEWSKIMLEISEATPGRPTEGSSTYLFSKGGVGPRTPHVLLFYTFPTDAGAPEFTALSLVPQALLERTFNVDSPSVPVEAVTSSEQPQRTKATFTLQNSGSVDCVYTIVSKPGWATVDAPFNNAATAGEVSLKLAAGTSVTFKLTFDGTGLDHDKLQGNLVLSLEDDDYPDCYVQELRQIALHFDHRNPCTSTPEIENIATGAGECNNTVSGMSCLLACEKNYVPTAATVQCIDGRWAEETCTLVEESASYVQYIVLPVGMALATGLLGYAAYKQDLALEVVFALMKDTLILAASLSLELLDIVSDCIVLYMINSREDLEHFVIYFSFFFGIGLLVFICHVVINSYYLFTMMMGADASSFEQLKKEAEERQLKWDAAKKRRQVIPDDSNRTHSIALDTNTGNELSKMELRMKFVTVSHDCKMAQARTQRLMGLLALLVCEDLPMLILNIMIVSADTSDQPKTALLISLTLSSSLMAFKMSSIGGLVGLRTLTQQHQKEAMDCLDELKKMEMS